MKEGIQTGRRRILPTMVWASAFVLTLLLPGLMIVVVNTNSNSAIQQLIGEYAPALIDSDLRPMNALLSVLCLSASILFAIALAKEVLSRDAKVFMLLFLLIATSSTCFWISFYGMTHDEILLPVRGIHWIGRAKHPGVFWGSNAIWIGFAVFFLYIPAVYFQKKRRMPKPE